MRYILFLLIGLLAGYLAGLIMKNRGYQGFRALGWVGHLAVGVLGAFLGGFLFSVIGFAGYTLAAQLVMAIVGAVVLLALLGLVARK